MFELRNNIRHNPKRLYANSIQILYMNCVHLEFATSRLHGPHPRTCESTQSVSCTKRFICIYIGKSLCLRATLSTSIRLPSRNYIQISCGSEQMVARIRWSWLPPGVGHKKTAQKIKRNQGKMYNPHTSHHEYATRSRSRENIENALAKFYFIPFTESN